MAARHVFLVRGTMNQIKVKAESRIEESRTVEEALGLLAHDIKTNDTVYDGGAGPSNSGP